MMLINDYILKQLVNIDNTKITLSFDEKTNFLRPIRIYSHFTITLQNHKLDRFNKSYVELEKPFNYPLMIKVIEQFKEQYPEHKVYLDLKKIYTRQLTRVNILTLLGTINNEKKTISLTLHA